MVIEIWKLKFVENAGKKGQLKNLVGIRKRRTASILHAKYVTENIPKLTMPITGRNTLIEQRLTE